MNEFINSIVLFLLFYVPLRLMRNAWLKGKLDANLRWVAGLMAWGALLTSPAPLIVLLLVLGDTFAHASMGSMFTVGSLLMLASVLGYLALSHPELLDYAGMKEFWYRSLHFQNPAARRDNVFHELDWHEIAKRRAEETGKPLKREKVRNPEIPRTNPEQAMKELEKHRSESVPRVELEQELNHLKAGDAVDVTDALRLNSYRTNTNAQYDDIQSVLIDPSQGTVKCRLVFPSLGPARIANADGRFRVLQEVYDVMHALQGELWLKHYEAHFATLLFECYRVETDSFDMPTQVPFLRVHCPLTELRTHADRLYIVTEFTRLHRAEWLAQGF